MGVLRSTESFEAEVEDFRRMLLLPKQRQNNNIKGDTSPLVSQGSGCGKDKLGSEPTSINDDERRICVTSGVSFLGFSIVNRLLAHRYTVRLLLDTQEDLEKVREMETMFDSEEAEVVVADMMDVESLCDAFQGCSGVFHTSSFTDPTGLSGYSKHMVEIEARTGERVIEACVRTQTVRRCVFTSSLLACIWRRNNSPHHNRLRTVVDENRWSDESHCRDTKLWYALGKTMAEKAAWRAARGTDLKLATLCPGLVTGPGFRRRSSTASIAYLKGAQDMMREGLLATVDVNKLAEAHVVVYEEMGRTACGRYLCFDHVIRRAEDVAELEQQLGLIPSGIFAVAPGSDRPQELELSKRKLSRLMAFSSRRRCYHDTMV